MYKTKGFRGAILLTLVAICSSISLTCGAKPAEAPTSTPPISTQPKILTNYTTYTDKSGIFSISYPSDWQTSQLMPTLEKNMKQATANIKTNIPVEESAWVFSAGRQASEELNAEVFNPELIIVIGPVPEGSSSLDSIIDSVMEKQKATSGDLRELSRRKVTIDGRDAIIEEQQWLQEGKARFYCYKLYTVSDKIMWMVNCVLDSGNPDQWKDNFDTMVRSLRIYH
jgi:hypothetical protein